MDRHSSVFLVLVDKPVTTSTEQARQLAVIARTKGLVLAPFQNARWNSDFLALRKLLSLPESSSNSLGSIIDFEAQFVPPELCHLDLPVEYHHSSASTGTERD